MNSVILLLGTLVLFLIGYRIYGRFLERIYQIDPKLPTPAHTKRDEVDFVPAKNWLVLFGHHFSSICGAGPIVGPILAAAYWGWGLSWIWIVGGVIFMGAVADFSSLIVSVRSEGKGISEVALTEISSRARMLFSLFIWLSLILIIAVFAILAAKTFIQDGTVVAPSLGLIPVAILTGWLLYRTKMPDAGATIVGLGLLALLLWGGGYLPLVLPSGGLGPQNSWIVILLIYCFAASIAPVNILLQPRDYLAAFLLFGSIGVGLIAVLYQHPTMSAPFYTNWNPSTLWPQAGPVFPMLFVTIACGAISGFHSLVASGTTCKQIDTEGHCRRIGYGGMITEAVVGILVLICAAAILDQGELRALLHSGGPIAAFGEGYGRLSSFLLGDYGKPFAILALNAFILTTLDTSTRIARYLTMDLFHVRNKYTATLVVVVAAGALAMTGQWTRIWPAFGTANQLVAGLALLVASAWLAKRGRPVLPMLIPALLMLVVTTAAFVYQMISVLKPPSPDYFIAATCLVLIILSAVVFMEALKSIVKPVRL